MGSVGFDTFNNGLEKDKVAIYQPAGVVVDEGDEDVILLLV